jgi:hypothetical protein
MVLIPPQIKTAGPLPYCHKKAGIDLSPVNQIAGESTGMSPSLLLHAYNFN